MTQSDAAPILVEVGAGELIDKITILRIKSERMSDQAKIANVRIELETLEAARAKGVARSDEIARLESALKSVNEALWDIEDDIRECEAKGDFGDEFVRLARAVYQTNDKRAALKKEINLAAGSRIVEEKSYFEAP